MPLNKIFSEKNSKVLLLGSGGLTIGQAGEFDYSGTQAVKSLRELGLTVIVINPNIATVQTDPQEGVKVYLYPVELHWVEKIIAIERPAGIVAGFGGQTALNCVCQLEAAGILEKYNVKNLGTAVATLRMTEDRDLFAQRMKEIQIPIPDSVAVETVANAKKAAAGIGYPVIVRAAYALGGLGSGFADNENELETLVEGALATSPQVLVEKSLRGWKEIEYEVMRDSRGNIIAICNMENFDPLGIHTGDSIVVCPSLSLNDDDYQMLRNAALKIVQSCEVVGECNVQFGLNPKSLEFCVIEVNARLSRSSALASKASGYPIAAIAAKVVCGFDLLELRNPVNGVTSAFFEPALDYITVKIPRWDLGKFKGATRSLGSTMKSVGEVMGIGRNFCEALQKAVRMVTENSMGISSNLRGKKTLQEVKLELQNPTDTRIYAVFDALHESLSVEEIYKLSAIDPWFLTQCLDIVTAESAIKKKKALKEISADELRSWKRLGFSDDQIAGFLKVETKTVREYRKGLKILPYVKKIDTTAAEHPSMTNYFYLSYEAAFHDPMPAKNKISALILGSGSYRIGTSVEFDWCAVSTSFEIQKHGYESIILNCNPETVSTDFNNSNRLYFDEMTIERVLDICDLENPAGVIASMGGQLPNKLAMDLAKNNIKLLGHSSETIDLAENRSRFSKILDELKIDQPRWASATSLAEIDNFVRDVGYPILIRPSYVLSGAAMSVVYDRKSLQINLELATEINRDHPVVISEYIVGAKEIELDGVAQNGEVIISAVTEHIENAGVHSGDATMVIPPQKLYYETVRRVQQAGQKIARGLKLNGPFNIQFLAKSNHIKVIECNARAARSFPFVSKVIGHNLAKIASQVLIEKKLSVLPIDMGALKKVGVKAPLFSYSRLAGVDPVLGVEMASTGEVGCVANQFEEAFLLAMESSKIYAPVKAVLVSSGPERQKLEFLEAAKILEELGLKIYATPGTFVYLTEHKVKCQEVDWKIQAIELIRLKTVDLVINVPKTSDPEELLRGSYVRQAALRFGIPLLTNIEKSVEYMRALAYVRDFRTSHVPTCLEG